MQPVHVSTIHDSNFKVVVIRVLFFPLLAIYHLNLVYPLLNFIYGDMSLTVQHISLGETFELIVS